MTEDLSGSFTNHPFLRLLTVNPLFLLSKVQLSQLCFISLKLPPRLRPLFGM